MHRLFERLEPGERERLRRRARPEWTRPMLATLVHDPFSRAGWIFERKLDGERCLAFCSSSGARLRSRNRKDLGIHYPELEEALARQAGESMVLDGEVVAFKGSVTSFERLQARMQVSDPEKARHSGVAVYYYLFDILHLAGHDLTGLPLRARKRVLRGAVRFRDPVRFTIHRNRDGEEFLRQACRKGWEGLIAKDASSGYVHRRSRDWLKFKCAHRQEFVIGGYTDPQGERVGFGALLVGFHEDGELSYAGKVGTGYDDETLARLGARLERLERKTPPFADRPREKGAHWVTPRLVGEVGFTEWTRGNRLRHPRFLGLREDKDPKDVVRERPE
ncbi:non-homologous end-joining DNA ligase [candidate division WOR-3 bacterium]|nr:non-homologous end-joining DNA ligase [candidate division WOR-3 bacterium]